MKESKNDSASPRPTLSVVIAAYNEAFTLPTLLKRVAAVPIDKEIIIVDDASTDGTREFLQKVADDPQVLKAAGSVPSIKILFHKTNQGKGAALRTAIAQANGVITVIQDADLEYDPAEYRKLIDPILRGEADVVYGSRFRGEINRVRFFWHSLGNRLLTLCSNLFTNLNLTDMETCYKAFKTDILKSIPIRCDRFGFEPEITAKVAKLRCRIYEVPISYHGRGYDEGKKITWYDGIKAILTILRFWLVDDLYQETAGLRTLRIMEGAGAYNRWLFDQCRPFLGDRVLEVGAGVGSITKFLLDRSFLLVTDFEESYVGELKRSYPDFEHVSIMQLDLLDPRQVESLSQKGAINSILTMNVLEHIEDDAKALYHLYSILPRGGRLVILVPAHPFLFCRMDQTLGHFRRYNRQSLCEVIKTAGFTIQTSRYLNWVGAIGWFLNGRLLRRRLIPSSQLRFFDFLLFLLKIERFWTAPFGLSVMAVATKE